jgi:hypothetical protein
MFQSQASNAMAKMADFMLSNAKHTTGSALTSAATGLVSGLGHMVSATSSSQSKSDNTTAVNATAAVLQVGVSSAGHDGGSGGLGMRMMMVLP